VQKGQCAFDHLNGLRFMNLLPVIDWIRSISDWHAWSQPPLRACFMFDDPNLHAKRYGFIEFKHLAEEGRRNRYHTAFATIPLDSRYVNQAAAQIIRENRDTLSFLTHGNNHTHRELAQAKPTTQQLAQMRQAAFRVQDFEQRARIVVSRVMAPPHGVCSATMMAAARDAGFEAGCASHGSVWTGNIGARWTAALGTSSATVINGFPVIPRFRLHRQIQNQVLIAACLHQPIIPVGHHWDLIDGTDILASVASFINTLGTVAWADMTAVARSNYRCKVEGELMRVQSSSRISSINVPEGVSVVQLETPWLDPDKETVRCYHINGASRLLAREHFSSVFSVTPGSNVNFAAEPNINRISAKSAASFPKTPLRVIGRRVLGEMRDRSMPHLPRNLCFGILNAKKGVRGDAIKIMPSRSK
jgi:hypothetical protein